MPRPVPWSADLLPAAATVTCGGQIHAVIWRDGALQLQLEVLDAMFVLEARPRGDGILDLVCLDLERVERTHSDRGWGE